MDSNPGLLINKTPANPKPTALQRFALTFSFKKKMLSRVTNTGPAKVIAVTSANCKFLKAIKIATIAMAPNNDL